MIKEDTTMDEKFIAALKAKAAELTSYERNPEICLAEEGDVNDAYGTGYYDGKIHMARTVLRAMGLL